jgi:hypothetical protein
MSRWAADEWAFPGSHAQALAWTERWHSRGLCHRSGQRATGTIKASQITDRASETGARHWVRGNELDVRVLVLEPHVGLADLSLHREHVCEERSLGHVRRERLQRAHAGAWCGHASEFGALKMVSQSASALFGPAAPAHALCRALPKPLFKRSGSSRNAAERWARGGTRGDACDDHARGAHALENLWRRTRSARAGTVAFRYFGWPGPGLRREQGSTSMSAIGEGHRRYHGVTLKKGHTAEPGPRRGRILPQCWQEANAAHIGQGQSPPRWDCTGLLKGSQ